MVKVSGVTGLKVCVIEWCLINLLGIKITKGHSFSLKYREVKNEIVTNIIGGRTLQAVPITNFAEKTSKLRYLMWENLN